MARTYRKVLTTQLNHLASLAKWLSVSLRTKWFPGPTGITAVVIGGNAIHFGLETKPETSLLFLNDKSKSALIRNK